MKTIANWSITVVIDFFNFLTNLDIDIFQWERRDKGNNSEIKIMKRWLRWEAKQK
jgi:hypothetical protein